jgi:hypothetical protein
MKKYKIDSYNPTTFEKSIIEKKENSKDENYSSLENRKLFEQVSFHEDLSRNRFNKVCTFQNQILNEEKS